VNITNAQSQVPTENNVRSLPMTNIENDFPKDTPSLSTQSLRNLIFLHK